MSYNKLVEEIVDALLEGGIQKAVISKEAAEQRASHLAAMRAKGERPGTSLYSDPDKNAAHDPLVAPHQERISFLTRAIEDGFVTTGTGEKKPIGPRIKQSMRGQLDTLQAQMGNSAPPTERSAAAQRDLHDIFSDGDSRSSAPSLDSLFKAR